MAQQGKRIRSTYEGLDAAKLYPIQDAVKLVKERAKAKFDETIEVSMNLGVDPRQGRQGRPRHPRPDPRDRREEDG